MQMFAYVGSRTTRERNARGEGITVYRVDPRQTQLERVQVITDLVNPSYLVLSGDGRVLYTVHGDRSEVSAFRVDRATGQLTWLNTADTRGLNPVHLVLDAEERHLIVTNHLGASLAVLPIGQDGALLPVSQLVHIDGPLGPHRTEQKQAKPHFALFDAARQHLIVPDKGVDRVFLFDYAAGHVQPSAQAFVTAREGAGPRHAALHPNGRLVYVVNELDSTVTAYRFDPLSGTLAPFQVLSSLPDTFTGNSRTAAIAIDPSGRCLYVSNRGHDSVTVFHIDPGTGRLRWAAAAASGGQTPRFFTLSPDARTMFALNEDSDTITSFSVDAQTGLLQATGWQTRCGSPVCMVFSPTV